MKTLRFVKMAFRHLIPSKLRMDLKERSRYLSINPEIFTDLLKTTTMGKSTKTEDESKAQ